MEEVVQMISDTVASVSNVIAAACVVGAIIITIRHHAYDKNEEQNFERQVGSVWLKLRTLIYEYYIKDKFVVTG